MGTNTDLQPFSFVTGLVVHFYIRHKHSWKGIVHPKMKMSSCYSYCETFMT